MSKTGGSPRDLPITHVYTHTFSLYLSPSVCISHPFTLFILFCLFYFFDGRFVFSNRCKVAMVVYCPSSFSTPTSYGILKDPHSLTDSPHFIYSLIYSFVYLSIGNSFYSIVKLLSLN